MPVALKDKSVPSPRRNGRNLQYTANFNIGTQLLERIDFAVIDSETYSRNTWLLEAIQTYLQADEPLPLPITAEQLLANKVQVQLRISGLMLELVNERCVERGVTRTTWLLDACLSKLAAG